MHKSLGVFWAVFITAFSLPALADFTHLSVDHRDIIHLRLANGSTSVCGASGVYKGPLKLVRAGGQMDANEYFVPVGRELIITDIFYVVKPSFDSSTAEWGDRAVQFSLRTINADSSLGDTLVRLPTIDPPDGVKTYQSDSVSLTTGVRLAPGRALCGNARSVAVTGFYTSGVVELEVFGYLIDKLK